MNLPQTRASLLVRLRDRSGDAWSEFLQIYEGAILNFARRKGLQEADARDVAQEVLTAVAARVNSWRHDQASGRFRGWLFRVARNVAVDRVVELARTPNRHRELCEVDAVAESSTDDGQFDTAYCQQLMRWATDKIRPQVADSSWQAFWMTAVEGRPGDQVAQTLGMSRGAVYAAKFRVVARVRALVERFDDPDRLPFVTANEVDKPGRMEDHSRVSE